MTTGSERDLIQAQKKLDAAQLKALRLRDARDAALLAALDDGMKWARAMEVTDLKSKRGIQIALKRARDNQEQK